MYLYECVHMYVRACMYVSMWVHMCIFLCELCTCVHVHMYVSEHMMHMLACVYVSMCVSVGAHTCVKASVNLQLIQGRLMEELASDPEANDQK